MLLTPRIAAPLDPGFHPAVLAHRHYLRTAVASGRSVPLVIGLEREEERLSRFSTVVLPEGSPLTLRHVERIVKFLLWARGGWRLWFGGPRAIGEYVAQCYSPGGERKFDVELMSRVYERPFEVVLTDAASVPAEHELNRALGGHLNGYRIGFDLGASDFKLAAVRDGQVVFSDEFPWDPKHQPDPHYHYDRLSAGLKQAASHLPRVDAIGGSSAGVIVDNRIMVASLFRAVPVARFDEAKNLFLRIRDEWKVPLEVANDGDVTALAGAMSLNVTGVLGLAMGSSQAAGFLNPQGGMTGWLNELAFAPVDYRHDAEVEEWSGDCGVGALYFSQQAVNKLLPASGIHVPKEMGLPERLKEVQALMAKGDARATRIYETIGVYLGYAIPQYAEFYEFTHALILGRVTTGPGGETLLAMARRVLAVEFPELAGKIRLHLPDEKSRRVGQAVAAASLPAITPSQSKGHARHQSTTA
jgi:predicted NBD/HSP70 family sugar kinase